MIEAPKEIWISPTNYRWWTSPCEDLPLLHRYIHAAESKEAADRIEQLEATLAQYREATNQCRLAFAGYVPVASAVNKLDALGQIQEKDDA